MLGVTLLIPLIIFIYWIGQFFKQKTISKQQKIKNGIYHKMEQSWKIQLVSKVNRLLTTYPHAFAFLMIALLKINCLILLQNCAVWFNIGKHKKWILKLKKLQYFLNLFLTMVIFFRLFYFLCFCGRDTISFGKGLNQR